MANSSNQTPGSPSQVSDREGIDGAQRRMSHPGSCRTPSPPSRACIPSSGLTRRAGFTCELPPPMIWPGSAHGPITATEVAAEDSGSTPPSFLSSTAPATATR